MAGLCEVGTAGLALFAEKSRMGRWFIRRRILSRVTFGRAVRFWDVWRYERKALGNLKHINSETIEVNAESVEKTNKQIWKLADLIAVKSGKLPGEVMEGLTLDEAQDHLQALLWEELLRKLDLVLAHHNPKAIFEEIESFKLQKEKRARKAIDAPKAAEKVQSIEEARAKRAVLDFNGITPQRVKKREAVRG